MAQHRLTGRPVLRGLLFAVGCSSDATCRSVQGRFILSLKDVPEVREVFAWASIEAVELSYQAAGGWNTKRAREVVITDRREG